MSGVVRTSGAGFVAREGALGGKSLVVVESGVGSKAAAHGTRALIEGHRPRWVISAGLAGGLDPRLKLGDVVMADRIVDLEGNRLDIDLAVDRSSLEAARGVYVGPLVTVERIVRTAAEKRQLAARSEALAVDMESMGVAEVCRLERVPCLAIRAISDPADHDLPRDIEYLLKRRTAAGRLGAAARAVMRRPASIKDMWRLKEDALNASERLAKFLVGVVDQLH